MENQLDQISNSDYIYIRYEDFLSKPYDELEKIYRHLDLKFEFSSDRMESLKRPKDYKHYFTEQELKNLNESIINKLNQWGYN